MTCLDVRERLSEYALGVLARPEARDVARHLEWCQGCRKEAEELQEGTASVALSLAPTEPPALLEHRVVDRITAVAGTGRRGSRRGFRLLVVATLAAFVLAIGAVAWGVRESNRSAVQEAAFNTRLNRLSALLSGSGSRLVNLSQVSLTPDEGWAVVYSSPKQADLVLVDVYPAGTETGPYRFKLFDRSGKVVTSGTLRRTLGGDYLFFSFTGIDLSGASWASVFNGRNEAILTGRFQASPTG